MPQDGLSATTLSGSSVELIDIAGNKRSAQLLLFRSCQIQTSVSPDLEIGPVLVNVLSGTRLTSSGYLQLERSSPSIFTANGDGKGVFAGEALLSSANRSSTLPVSFTRRSEHLGAEAAEPWVRI